MKMTKATKMKVKLKPRTSLGETFCAIGWAASVTGLSCDVQKLEDRNLAYAVCVEMWILHTVYKTVSLFCQTYLHCISNIKWIRKCVSLVWCYLLNHVKAVNYALYWYVCFLHMLYVSKFDERSFFIFLFLKLSFWYHIFCISECIILFLIFYASCFLNMINEINRFLFKRRKYVSYIVFCLACIDYCLFFNFIFSVNYMTSFRCYLILNALFLKLYSIIFSCGYWNWLILGFDTYRFILHDIQCIFEFVV